MANPERFLTMDPATGAITRDPSVLTQLLGAFIEADGAGGLQWKENLGFIYPASVTTSAQFLVEKGKTVRIEGDLTINMGAVDATGLLVREGAKLVVTGNLLVTRAGVAAATRLVDIAEGAEVIVGGSMTTTHAGGGATEGVVIHGKSELYVKGATSITSDCADAAWAVGLYAYDGWNKLTFIGGLTVVMSAVGKHWPMYLSRTDVTIGDEKNLTGGLALTDASNTSQADGVVFLSGGRFRVYGTTVITANSLVTQPGIVAGALSTVSLLGNLTISMSAQTSGRLLWTAHCTAFNCTIAALTTGVLTAQAILIENSSKVEIVGASNIAGNGGTMLIREGSTVHVADAFSLGTVGSPSTVNISNLLVQGGSSLVCDSTLVVYRNVAATTSLVNVENGSHISIAGAATLDHGGGTSGNNVIYALRTANGASVDFVSTLTALSDAAYYSHVIWAETGSIISVKGACTLTADGGVAARCLLVCAVSCAKFLCEGAFSGSSTNTGTYPNGLITAISQGTMRLNSTVQLSGAAVIDRAIEAGNQGSIYIFGAVTVTLAGSSASGMIQAQTMGKIEMRNTLSLTCNSKTCIVVDQDSTLIVVGIIDIVAAAAGATTADDGVALKISNSSKAIIKGLMFNGGADLALGPCATVYASKNSKLLVTGSTGNSDAVNLTDTAAVATGIRLLDGSQVFAPAWTSHTGICAKPAAGSALDTQVGAVAAANYGGSERLVDAAQLCYLSKP